MRVDWAELVIIAAIVACHTIIIMVGVALTQWATDTLTPVHLLTWTVALSAPGLVLLLLMYIRGVRRERDLARPAPRDTLRDQA
jgi:O-antigen/teichoic acid export membrane protein